MALTPVQQQLAIRQETFSRSHARHGSVQARFVDVRRIHDHIICLGTQTSGSLDYATILQIEGISYDLKSEGEQRLINDLYQAFLCALPYPMQILWRVLPLDLAGYLAQFSSEASSLDKGVWEPLVDSHRRFLEHLASQRTLLDRKIYLVIRLNHLPAKQTWQPFTARKQQQQQATRSLERARQELDLRVSEVSRLLTSMHVSVRRLSGEQELAPLYYSCLMPKRARHAPLAPQLIEGIDRPVLAQLPSSPPLLPSPSRRQPKVVFQSHDTPETEAQDGLQQKAMTAPAGTPSFSHLTDLIAPSAVVISPDLLKVEDEYARTLVISHLPRIVAPGWLKPLAELDEPMDVSFHVEPLNSSVMISAVSSTANGVPVIPAACASQRQ